MARKGILFISIFTVILALIVQTKCSKLNVPRVLLPIFNDFSTNFTLEVTEGGCYKWTTSRLDLVQLVTELGDQECSSRIMVSTISKEPTKNTAIVLAEDIYTGQILRCDVIVDVIATLNIVTTTRELFMEEAPEAFEVRAYDDQGNEFTTLQGIEFEWSLTSPASSVLRFITFRDSPYETPATVAAFEEQGLQGHIILLEGVKTGSSKISVKLPHAEYKDLPGIDCALMVIANLIIEPSDSYILRGDVVHYKIIQVKHGRLEEINLPSSQYYLVSENSEIGAIEKNSGYLTGMTIGKTKVFLHDRNVNEESGLKLPSASISVTYPNRIGLSLLPYRNWAILQGDQHNIVAEIFASNDHKIHIGEGVRLNTVVDEQNFSVSQRSVNGSWISGKGTALGIAEVKTTLVSVISNKLGTVNLSPVLTSSAEILIYPRISIDPAEVVLPWDPVVRPKFEIGLKAIGGDGKFLWSTSNHTVGVVTQLGLIRTQWHGLFDTCASMTRNHHLRKCVRVNIVPPTRLEIIEFVMESDLGAPIFLQIALYATLPNPNGIDTEYPFTRCQELTFEIKPTDRNFYYNETAHTDLIGVACASIAVASTVTGTSRVTVQYKRDNIHLEESVTVAAYRPLRLLHPGTGQTVLALGTSRNLIFTGGPRPWLGRASSHVVKVNSTDNEVVEVIDNTPRCKGGCGSGSDMYVINAVCKEFGEAIVTLAIYNKPLVPNCKYVESTASVHVFCSKPKYIYLQPEMKVADTSRCPMDLSSERIIVQSYQDIDLLVSVKDCAGRKFDNISSFDLKWDLSPETLGTLKNPNGVYEKYFLEENIILPNKSFNTLTPKSATGSIDVGTTILGYQSSVLKNNNVRSVPITETITTLITLYLVDDTIVAPNTASVYNHPLNHHELEVAQGSGYYELALSNDLIAEVKYNQATKQIEIIPKKTGSLQISVKDLCLSCPPVVVNLNIVYVASMRLEMTDRVEIGKCIAGIVKFYDINDKLMPLPKLEYIDIRPMLKDRIINVKLAEVDPDTPWGVGEVHYVISGLQLGETSLSFAAGRGEKEVNSLPIEVQVFAPLRISPKNTTLFIGAVLQFSSEGGPQPDTNIEYTIESDTIADIRGNGIVHALNLGHTKVIARSVSVNPINGQKVVNSQDQVELYVIPLLGIKLSAPLQRFVVGATVPVWVTGLPEKLSSLTLGSVEPPLIYLWTTKCIDVVHMHGVLRECGICADARNRISVRVTGLKPGHCTLELSVTVPGFAAGFPNKAKIPFSSSIDLEVIEELDLTSPTSTDGKALLIAPFTKLQLKTNRDRSTGLTYSIHGEVPGEENSKSVSITKQILSVSRDGVIQSYGNFGRALVVIKAVDEQGLKQTLNVVVQVKAVQYMLANIVTVWKIPEADGITVLPLGAEFKFVITFHDNTGLVFQAAQCDLHFKANRYDLLQVKRGSDNTSLSAASVDAGTIVMKIWADNCLKAADYIMLYGEQIAIPRAEYLTSGDVVCMRSPVKTCIWKPGVWTSEPENIMTLNAATGIGYVVTSRTVQLYIKYSLTPAFKMHFNVAPVVDISYRFDRTKTVSNSPNTKLKVPVLFRGLRNPEKENNLYAGWPCQPFLDEEITFFPFICIIVYSNESLSIPDIATVFNVTRAFNKDLGLYSCDLSPSNPITENTSTIESNITIRVVSDNGANSAPMDITFIPAIYVDSKELIVSETTFSATLTVTGLSYVLKQIKIAAFDPALVTIGKVHHVSPTMDTYEITLIDYHWKLDELKDPLSISVTSLLTSQCIMINVKLGSDQAKTPFCSMNRQMGSPLGNFLYENRQTVIIILSMLILFFVTFYAYSHYMQPVINVNVSERSMLLNTSSPSYYNSSNSSRSFAGCTRSTCYNLNSTTLNNSRTSPMRYGTGEVCRDSRNCSGNSPELRRNRRFL